jgi:hypothetical protein
VSRYLWLSAIASLALLLLVLYLIRTRKLHERYALIWLTGAFAIGLLAAWPAALAAVARLLGIASPPNALFLVLGAFFIWVLLHGAVALTRLSRQNVTLAQRVALLETRLRSMEDASVEREAGDGDALATGPPVSPHD